MGKNTTTRRITRLSLVACILAFFLGIREVIPVRASSGTEGASFLDIPVGAGPAAMGSAYTALATDAYAPVWNPGALPYVQSNSMAAQYLSYVQAIQYEFASFVHPFASNQAIGASVQYLGSGDIAGTDLSGNPTGSFTADFGAYSLSYGRALNNKLSLGITGKLIHESISDVTANAFGVDLGSMYKLNQNTTLAATLTNMGSKLTFLSTGDSLPLAFHLSGAYHWSQYLLSMEGIFRQTGFNSFRVGGEWNPLPEIALRAGYKTDNLNGLSPLAGLTLGVGIKAWGQEFSYAWLPMGDLGNTQYFSIVIHFGATQQKKGNLIQYHPVKRNPSDTDNESAFDSQDPLLEDQESHVAKATTPSASVWK